MVAAVMAHANGLGGPGEIWSSIVRDFSNIGDPGAMAAFVQVLMIDLVLAGDNAIVVGALAADSRSPPRADPPAPRPRSDRSSHWRTPAG
jgi:hypothetical protein